MHGYGRTSLAGRSMHAVDLYNKSSTRLICSVLQGSLLIQGRDERYDSKALVLGRFGQKNEKNRFERYGQNNKNKKYKGVMLWAADVCSRAAFAQPGPVFLS